MAAEWKKKLATARASGGGDYLGGDLGSGRPEDGSGVVIVNDLKVIKVYGEPYQFTAELFVEVSNGNPQFPDSKPAPVGSSRSYVAQLSKFESAAANMKGVMVAIDPDLAAMSEDESIKTTDQVLRVAEKDDASKGWEEGRTMPGTVCAVRGARIAFKTRRKWTKGTPTKPSHEIVLVDFSHIPGQSPETMAAACALVDAKNKA